LSSKLKEIAQAFKREIQTYQLLLKDSRTPRLPKWLLALAVGYALMPFDLIPDFLPVIGHLDDVIIISLLIYLALKMIPKNVIDECRQKAQNNNRP
jgi:uncharacterized membrane protein YkvA (DUF1232 family)